MKKTTQTKPVSKKKSVAAEIVMPETNVTPVNVAPKKFIWILLLVVLVGAGILFAKKYKGLVIAGTVNGKAITRWELEKAMNDRYAKSTFDDLASTLLLQQLAAQNGISASQEDINKEVAATEDRLGGKEALAQTLERIGYTDARFREEIATQVLVKKLAEKLFKAEVTDEEVSKFYQENKTLFPDKKFDEVKADIRQNLEQQKLQEQFTAWFQEQRKNALVVSYI